MTPRSLILSLGVALMGTNAAGQQNRTFLLDPVALLDRGEEVAGSPALSETHHIHTYLFASDEAREVFRRDPERYEIQLGGACARMGPLSGEGDPQIWAVHDGRVYVFASTQCREGFLKAPERLLECDDPRPDGSPDQAERGRALIETVARAIGGGPRIDSLRNYVEIAARDEESSGRTYHVTKSLTLAFPEGVREDDAWNEAAWSSVVGPHESFFVSTSEPEGRPMHVSQRRALERRAERHLLRVLAARHDPDFVALAQEADDRVVGGAQRVITWHDGVRVTLDVEPDGTVSRVEFKGRGPSMVIGEVVLALSDYIDVDGLRVPLLREASFDGEPAPSLSQRLTEIRLNVDLSPETFQRPPAPRAR